MKPTQDTWFVSVALGTKEPEGDATQCNRTEVRITPTNVSYGPSSYKQYWKRYPVRIEPKTPPLSTRQGWLH